MLVMASSMNFVNSLNNVKGSTWLWIVIIIYLLGTLIRDFLARSKTNWTFTNNTNKDGWDWDDVDFDDNNEILNRKQLLESKAKADEAKVKLVKAQNEQLKLKKQLKEEENNDSNNKTASTTKNETTD